jgi:response regulator RpfG family c-di-GMP phosphodiesterase
MIDDQWLAAQLRARSVVSQAQLDAALRREGGDLTQNLVATGAVPEADLLKFLGLLFQTRYVSTEKLSSAKIPQWVLDLLPLELCEKHLVLPVRCDKQKTELSIVAADPSEAGVKELVQRSSGAGEVKVYLALRYAIEAAIRRYYKGDIHAFARMDESLRQNYTELMSIYEQRLIDFEQEDAGAAGGAGVGIPLGPEGDGAQLELTTGPAASALQGFELGPADAAPPGRPARTSQPAGSDLESLMRAQLPRQTGPLPDAARAARMPTVPIQVGTGPHRSEGRGSYADAAPLRSEGRGSYADAASLRSEGRGYAAGAADAARKTTTPTSGLAAPMIGSELRGLDAESFAHAVAVLVNMIESGQGWRQGHSAEVARLAALLGERIGLDAEGATMLRLAAALHDLGKPPDPHPTLLSIELSPELRALAAKVYATPMKLLEAARLPPELEQSIASLYERVDGHGVPGKRYARDIPLAARILAVVDAYCDLTSNPRAPGGRTDDPEAAAQRLREGAARKLFDPEVVALLQQVVAETARDRLGGARAQVLLIDSDVGSTTVLEQRLAAAGLEVRVVRTTAEAALVVLSEKVDVILSEVRLEPVDGFVFLERLRADPRTSALPFIFVSDRADAEEVNRGFELGAIDYVVKPFTPEVLVAKLRRVLEQRAAR